MTEQCKSVYKSLQKCEVLTISATDLRKAHNGLEKKMSRFSVICIKLMNDWNDEWLMGLNLGLKNG